MKQSKLCQKCKNILDLSAFDDICIGCKSFMNQSNWQDKFNKTKLVKLGGTCWECCDYEGIVLEIKGFIRQLLDTQKVELLNLAYKEERGNYELVHDEAVKAYRQEIIGEIEKTKKDLDWRLLLSDSNMTLREGYNSAIDDVTKIIKGRIK